MNILTLNTPNTDNALVQTMTAKFLQWIKSTNTDLSGLSNAQIYHRLYELNSDDNGIVRRDLLENSYQTIISARVEQDEEPPLLPAGVEPSSDSQGDSQDDPNKLLPTDVGQPKKENNNDT